METGFSETLIGWKSGKTNFVPLRDWMEGARYGLRAVTEMYHYLKNLPRPFFKPTLGVIRGGQRNFFLSPLYAIPFFLITAISLIAD